MNLHRRDIPLCPIRSENATGVLLPSSPLLLLRSVRFSSSSQHTHRTYSQAMILLTNLYSPYLRLNCPHSYHFRIVLQQVAIKVINKIDTHLAVLLTSIPMTVTRLSLIQPLHRIVECTGVRLNMHSFSCNASQLVRMLQCYAVLLDPTAIQRICWRLAVVAALLV